MDAVKARPVPLSRRLLAEALGTALLVTVVVGSGISAAECPPTTWVCNCWRTAPRRCWGWPC